MSSFFKCSCFIYWISFLLFFAYMIGILRFQKNHVIVDQAMANGMMKMRILSIANTALAFLGCIFLKCNVNNIYCAILYTLPLAIVIPGIAVWGIIDLSPADKPPENHEIQYVIQDYFKTHHKFPHWLTQTEDEYNCCGLFGPTDYRQILRELGTKTCMEHANDIPCSCCIERQMFKESTLRGLSNCALDRDSEQCSMGGSKEWMKSVVLSNSTKSASLQAKCSPGQLTIDPKAPVFKAGCSRELRSAYVSVKRAMTAYFIIHGVCAVLMLVAFARHCFANSVLATQKSDYSLDVETLSMLELHISPPTNSKKSTS